MDPDNQVDALSVACSRMAARWRLTDALLGGTDEMRRQGQKYLPMEPRETPESYSGRLARSFLFNGLKDSIDKLASKPFSKPVNVAENDKLPEQLVEIQDDVDREGTDITAFGKSVLQDGLAHGQSHILVDYPSVSVDTNLKIQQDLKLRPYLVKVPAANLVGVKYRNVSGGRVLTEVRFKEKRVEAQGRYGEKEIDVVRVITENTWTLHKKINDIWVAGTENTHTFGGVPFVTLPINPVGFMEAEPPLQPLAELNLAHWQSSSDQRAILRFARLALLFGAGFSDEEVDKIELGPSALITASNANAKLMVVEHSGRAVEIGRNDLLDLELKMELLALQPLVSGPGNPTATGKSIDAAKAHSSMQAWIRNTESALTQAYRMAARWVNDELPEKFSVDIFSDFAVTLRAVEDIQALISLYAAGALSLKTLLMEVKRRGVLSDHVDVQTELDAIEIQGPRIDLPPPPPAADEDDEKPPSKKAKAPAEAAA